MIGINGMGRIGRTVMRVLIQRHAVGLVGAICDLVGPEEIAYLLSHDTVYGPLHPHEIVAEQDSVVVLGHRVRVLSGAAAAIPWKECGTTVVIEATGRVTTKAEAEARHLAGGANVVIITAPAEGVDQVIIVGVFGDLMKLRSGGVVSLASCTTNCFAPIIKVVASQLSVLSAAAFTVHQVTSDQRVVDSFHSKWTRGRSSENMIPTSSGAERVLRRLFPDIAISVDCMRVPVMGASFGQILFALREDCHDAQMAAIIAELSCLPIVTISDVPRVSSDFRGSASSAVIDTTLSKAVAPRLLKLCAWYDNEWGYSNRIVDAVLALTEA
jgi:glyceraldehyde 3-phosphate dehydrogenase